MSFNSYVPFRLMSDAMSGATSTVVPQLSEISLANAARTAVAWKQQRPEWLALSRLLTR